MWKSVSFSAGAVNSKQEQEKKPKEKVDMGVDKLVDKYLVFVDKWKNN